MLTQDDLHNMTSPFVEISDAFAFLFCDLLRDLRSWLRRVVGSHFQFGVHVNSEKRLPIPNHGPCECAGMDAINQGPETADLFMSLGLTFRHGFFRKRNEPIGQAMSNANGSEDVSK